MSDIFDSWCFSTKNMIIIFVKSEASQASLGSEKLSSTNYPFKCGWMEMFEPSNSFINKYMTFNIVHRPEIDWKQFLFPWLSWVNFGTSRFIICWKWKYTVQWITHQLFILVQAKCLQALNLPVISPCEVFEHYSLHNHPNPTVKHCVMVCICRKVQTEALPVYRWKLVMQLNHSGRFQDKNASTQKLSVFNTINDSLGRTPSHTCEHAW